MDWTKGDARYLKVRHPPVSVKKKRRTAPQAPGETDASFDFLTPAGMGLLVPSLWLFFRVFSRHSTSEPRFGSWRCGAGSPKGEYLPMCQPTGRFSARRARQLPLPYFPLSRASAGPEPWPALEMFPLFRRGHCRLYFARPGMRHCGGLGSPRRRDNSKSASPPPDFSLPHKDGTIYTYLSCPT